MGRGCEVVDCGGEGRAAVGEKKDDRKLPEMCLHVLGSRKKKNIKNDHRFASRTSRFFVSLPQNKAKTRAFAQFPLPFSSIEYLFFFVITETEDVLYM